MSWDRQPLVFLSTLLLVAVSAWGNFLAGTCTSMTVQCHLTTIFRGWGYSPLAEAGAGRAACSWGWRGRRASCWSPPRAARAGCWGPPSGAARGCSGTRSGGAGLYIYISSLGLSPQRVLVAVDDGDGHRAHRGSAAPEAALPLGVHGSSGEQSATKHQQYQLYTNNYNTLHTLTLLTNLVIS